MENKSNIEVKECGSLATASNIATIVSGVASLPIAIKVAKDFIKGK